jgi:hypothetical protein
MPKILVYKYRALNDRTLDIIQNEYIWYSKPSAFNDLFEFKTPHYISLTPEELIAHYRQRFDVRTISHMLLDRMVNHGDGTSAPIDETFLANFLNSDDVNITLWAIAATHFLAEQKGLSDREIASKLSITENNVLRQRLETDLRNAYANNFELGQTMGVLSLSARWDDPLMWAHYGDACRGICLGIEIDTDMLPDRQIPLVVRYVSEPEKLDPKAFFDREHSSVYDMLLKFYATKHVRWEHEREFRLLAPEGDRLYSLPGVIKEVILGLPPLADIAKSLVSALNDRPDISLFGIYNRPVDFSYARYSVTDYDNLDF